MSDVKEYIDLEKNEPDFKKQEFNLSFDDTVKTFEENNIQDKYKYLLYTGRNDAMKKRRKNNRRTYDMCEVNGVSMQGMYPENWFKNR